MIITPNLVSRLQTMTVIRRRKKIPNFPLFSLCFYCSSLFLNNRTMESQKQTMESKYGYFGVIFGNNQLKPRFRPNFMPVAPFKKKLRAIENCQIWAYFDPFLATFQGVAPRGVIENIPKLPGKLHLWVYSSM